MFNQFGKVFTILSLDAVSAFPPVFSLGPQLVPAFVESRDACVTDSSAQLVPAFVDSRDTCVMDLCTLHCVSFALYSVVYLLGLFWMFSDGLSSSSQTLFMSNLPLNAFIGFFSIISFSGLLF